MRDLIDRAFLIQNGKLVLGSSQGLVLIDFDGPQEAYAYDLSADLGLISVGQNKNSGVSNEYTAQKDQQIEGYESYQQIKADVDMGNITIKTE